MDSCTWVVPHQQTSAQCEYGMQGIEPVRSDESDRDGWQERERESFQVKTFYYLLKGTIRGSPSKKKSGAHGVMVIVVGNGYGDTRSNPGRVWLHFT